MQITSLFHIVAPANVNDARIFREQLGQWIEMAIALLDVIDGDADFEAETGVDQDSNPVTLNPEHRMPVKRITMRRAG